ncbi:MAG: hypothetical protein SGI99_12565 [Pseudomonadota bacterium]|nr:hypothetical protein [Pseudomonadota bacterium]
MKSKLLAALIGAALTPGLLHAACSIGSGQGLDPLLLPPQNPSPPPPQSTAMAELPEIGGSAPGYTTWINDLNDVPSEHTNFWEASNRSVTLVRDIAPLRLTGSLPARPPPPPPPGGGGGAICDSTNSAVTPSSLYFTNYLERTPVSLGLYRHQVQFDTTFYEGNSHPVSGRRSWWPLLAWIIPMEDKTEYTQVLRVDYSGWQTGFAWNNVNSELRVYLGETLVGSVVVETIKPSIELSWSADGQMLLVLDVGPTPGTGVVEIPLTSTVIENFQPQTFQVGRVWMPDTIRPSKGTIYAYSHLVESSPATGHSTEEERP